uniref:Secreted protein n=1 Tax=Caenorhabditis japonica TaxID=281687 RepID=A0A8R1E7Z5_CAEJA
MEIRSFFLFILLYSQYGALQTRSLRTVMDAATLATRECRKLREPWPMFRSDFSKPHSKCMRNSLFEWSELSAFYTEYTMIFFLFHVL